MMLTCEKCGVEKPAVGNFNRARTPSSIATYSRKGRNGYFSLCKTCVNKRVRESRLRQKESTKEKIRARVREWTRNEDKKNLRAVFRLLFTCELCKCQGSVDGVICECRKQLAAIGEKNCPGILKKHRQLMRLWRRGYP